MTPQEGNRSIAFNRQTLHDLHEGSDVLAALKPPIPMVRMLKATPDPTGVQLEIAYLKYLIGDFVIQRDIKNKGEITEFAALYMKDLKDLEEYLRAKGKLPPLQEGV